MTDMRLTREAHTTRPWRIHEVAPDFEVEDVWALPTPGGPADFDRLVTQTFRAPDRPGTGQPPLATLIWGVRWKLGEWLGWDRPEAGLDARVKSLRGRLPADLLAGPAGPDLKRSVFRSLYLADNEWAAEIANSTVHAVMHLSWVAEEGEGPEGRHRGQMAVLVKPNGFLGRAYLAAIKPFRFYIIYPALMRRMERQWLEAA